MKDNYFIHFLLILLLISLLFEGGLLLIGFLYADEVECNLLWCEFTKTYSSRESHTYSQCYINGIEVNCSEFTKDKEHFFNGSAYEMNGVMSPEEFYGGLD